MNKEQQELLNEAYKNYSKKMMYHPVENWLDDGNGEKTYRQLSQEEFINKCKTDSEFSEKWGLKIEERELNVDELNIVNLLKQTSTKLITITYNDKTIESYE
jgi:hypothetical protein